MPFCTCHNISVTTHQPHNAIFHLTICLTFVKLISSGYYHVLIETWLQVQKESKRAPNRGARVYFNKVMEKDKIK